MDYSKLDEAPDGELQQQLSDLEGWRLRIRNRRGPEVAHSKDYIRECKQLIRAELRRRGVKPTRLGPRPAMQYAGGSR